MQSMFDIIRDEMQKHNMHTLRTVHLCCGELSNVVPEALELAFEVMTQEGEFAGARLEIQRVPARLTCGDCKQEFSLTEGGILLANFTPCPVCNNEFGHTVLTGKEFYIANINGE